MKIVINILIFCFFTLLNAKGDMMFDTADNNVQDYVVKQLSIAIKDSEIVILQDRRDEIHRGAEYHGFCYGQQRSLGLWTVRFLGKLRGSINVGLNEPIFIYKSKNNKVPEIQDRETPPPRPYLPLFTSDDLTRLTFVKRQFEPIKDSIATGTRYIEWKPFAHDALKLRGSEFIAKYKIEDVFSNRVYKVVDGCVFHVDYPPPVMADTNTMIMENKMDKRDPEFVKTHFLRIQEYTKLSIIHLSKREVSEIVLIAYLLEGKKGVEQYSMARKDNVLLEPMEDLTLKTGIGKKLFASLKSDINFPLKIQ